MLRRAEGVEDGGAGIRLRRGGVSEREEERERVREQAEKNTEERLLDLLLPFCVEILFALCAPDLLSWLLLLLLVAG